ncbi:hypothetical protein [Ancylobacter sp. IITR112]|uniref:hypothetical protein n=1 Tax=Ancylobacter sp. IITR112 TaxID=3138073 RepID=UPI00352B25B9
MNRATIAGLPPGRRQGRASQSRAFRLAPAGAARGRARALAAPPRPASHGDTM